MCNTFRKNIYNISMLLLLLCSACATAQAQQHVPCVAFSGEYNGEVETDFDHHFNFINLLHLNADATLSSRLSFHLSTLSVARTNDNAVINDLQVFSNLDAENIPFALSVAALEWQIDSKNTLTAGIHHINDYCFASDVTGLFTNSSCGIYPTLSANYPIANYPVASVGVSFRHEEEHFALQTALFNGVGNRMFSGRDNVFRFCPKDDGIFALAQGEYHDGDNCYFLGGALHYGDPQKVDNNDTRGAVWAYGEHYLTDCLALIAGYSHAFGKDNVCRDFAGVGAQYSLNDVTLGAFTDYADFAGVREWATELTCQVPLGNHLTLQPALHFIRTDTEWNTAGTLRLICNF